MDNGTGRRNRWRELEPREGRMEEGRKGRKKEGTEGGREDVRREEG